jgi:predicted homoserine dehydrogenase-like protein
MIAQGRTVVTDIVDLLPTIPNIDVVVDATGNPEIGAKLGWYSLLNGKHVATFNVEADALVGSLLHAMAREKNLVYTGLAGDEPAAVLELIKFANFLELPVIAAGKGKNNTLLPSCTPDMFDSSSRAPSAKSMCSFVDGTNTMIEMAAVANAVGYRPDVSGMHGPNCSLEDIARLFVPKQDGGLLAHEQIVDYTLGSLAPGVFAVVRADHPVVDSIFGYVYKRQGKYLALIRPYHLLSLEAPISIAQAVLEGRTTIASMPDRRTAEVVAIAKRNLVPGDRIDGIGGYTVRGMIKAYEESVAEGLMPIGVLEGATVTEPVAVGQPISRGNVSLPEGTAAKALWERQLGWLRASDSERAALVKTEAFFTAGKDSIDLQIA